MSDTPISSVREVARLRAQLDAATEERDALRGALANVVAHTGLPPAPSDELLRGLLVSVARIARAALARRTP